MLGPGAVMSSGMFASWRLETLMQLGSMETAERRNDAPSQRCSGKLGPLPPSPEWLGDKVVSVYSHVHAQEHLYSACREAGFMASTTTLIQSYNSRCWKLEDSWA